MRRSRVSTVKRMCLSYRTSLTVKTASLLWVHERGKNNGDNSSINYKKEGSRKFYFITG